MKIWSINQTQTLPQETLGNGTYDVEVELLSKNGNDYVFAITSTGEVNSKNRVITQTLEVSPGQSWGIFGEYALYADAGDMELKQGVSIEGSIFSNGDITLKQGVSVTGGEVLATGAIDSSGGTTYEEGTLPDPLPSMPGIDTSYFNGELSIAATSNNYIVPSSLGGGTVYLQGDAELAQGSTLSGPGTLVVEGDFELKQGSTIGEDVTIITGGDFEIKQGGTVNTNAVIYAGGDIEFKQGSVAMTNVGLFAPNGSIELKQGGIFYGILYSGQEFEMKQGSTIVGSVIAGGHVEIKQGCTIIHDMSQFPDSIPQGIGSGGEEVQTTNISWSE